MPQLELYGTDWCTKSSALRNYLQSKWIIFKDFNVEKDKAAADRVRALYDGKLKFPTVKYGGHFLKNPNFKELNEFLKQHGIGK